MEVLVYHAQSNVAVNINDNDETDVKCQDVVGGII